MIRLCQGGGRVSSGHYRINLNTANIHTANIHWKFKPLLFYKIVKGFIVKFNGQL